MWPVSLGPPRCTGQRRPHFAATGWFPPTAVAVRATQTTAGERASGIGSCGRAAGGGARLPQPGESDPPVSPTGVSDPHQSLMGITDPCSESPREDLAISAMSGENQDRAWDPRARRPRPRGNTDVGAPDRLNDGSW